MRLGHDDNMLFKDISMCYDVDLDPSSMFIVNLPASEHGRPDLIEAKTKEFENLTTYPTF